LLTAAIRLVRRGVGDRLRFMNVPFRTKGQLAEILMRAARDKKVVERVQALLPSKKKAFNSAQIAMWNQRQGVPEALLRGAALMAFLLEADGAEIGPAPPPRVSELHRGAFEQVGLSVLAAWHVFIVHNVQAKKSGAPWKADVQCVRYWEGMVAEKESKYFQHRSVTTGAIDRDPIHIGMLAAPDVLKVHKVAGSSQEIEYRAEIPAGHSVNVGYSYTSYKSFSAVYKQPIEYQGAICAVPSGSVNIASIVPRQLLDFGRPFVSVSFSPQLRLLDSVLEILNDAKSEELGDATSELNRVRLAPWGSTKSAQLESPELFQRAPRELRRFLSDNEHWPEFFSRPRDYQVLLTQFEAPVPLTAQGTVIPVRRSIGARLR
jgi:hypothetical protein